MTARPSDVPATEPDPAGDVRLADDQVQVWLAPVAAGRLDDELRHALNADLDDVTRARVARFRRQQDRDRGLAAHALLRRLLGPIVHAAPRDLAFGTWCRACDSREHGKPWLTGFGAAPPLRFNLSHSGELVAVALAGPGLEVGVDVESRSRAVDWTALRRSVFADAEWATTAAAADPASARTDTWSRKESSVKATGHGLSTPLRAVLISADDEPGRAPGSWSARIGPRADSDGLHPEQYLAGWDVAEQAGVDEGYAAAVAVRVQNPMDEQPATALRPPVVRVAVL